MLALRIIGIALASLLTGCAFTPQAVVLKPEVHTAGSTVGINSPLFLNVIDERTKTTLGTRGVGGVGEELTISGDLTTIVKSALQDGLSKKGFEFDPSQKSTRQLRVELRALDYRVLMGFWAGTLKTESALKGICITNGTRAYEKLYRGSHEESVQVVQGEEANNRFVNIALSSSINRLLSDDALIECLAK